jgi:hypothetical protein
MILREDAMRCGFTWRLSLPTQGVDVDRLACPMREPMVYTCQMRGHGLLLGVVSSCLVLLLQWVVRPFGGREAPRT